MSAASAAFVVFATLAVLFSLLTILKRNPVASAFSLVMVFFSFAGIYACLGAHLIAALQILVYAGAIMVLFVFVIMLLNADEEVTDLSRIGPVYKSVVFFAGLVVWASLVFVFVKSGTKSVDGGFNELTIEAAGGNSLVLSRLMFSQYLLPFELTSILLLGAIVGSVAIAKRKQAGSTK